MLCDASWKKAARSRRTWRMGSKPFNAPSSKKIHTPRGTISPGSLCLPEAQVHLVTQDISCLNISRSFLGTCEELAKPQLRRYLASTVWMVSPIPRLSALKNAFCNHTRTMFSDMYSPVMWVCTVPTFKRKCAHCDITCRRLCNGHLNLFNGRPPGFACSVMELFCSAFFRRGIDG